MNQAMECLSQCDDVFSLESELRSLCTPFGSVSRLDIMTMTGAGKRQALCLLRLDSRVREQHLIATLGASRFGEDLCVVVDMKTSARA